MNTDMPCTMPRNAADTRRRGLCTTLLMTALAIIGFLVSSATLSAQNDPCLTDTLRMNTGYNYATNGVYPVGSYTPYWRVISDPDPSTTEPRPAAVINKYPSGWANPFPNSQWISSYPQSNNDLNGTYVLEFCFCLGPNAKAPRMVLDMLADDSAAVYVNGTYVGSTHATPPNAFVTPTHLVDNNAQHFRPGKNCIQVRLINTANVAMGLDISGYITASGVGLVKPNCCDSTGIIMGQKFWDQNCNGKKDPSDPGLAGWTIHLSNGMTAVTDALGNYYFFNVPPGTYVVNEINQAGWSQSFPASMTYTTIVTPGAVMANLDFGNCKKQTKDTCFLVGDTKIDCITIPGTTQKAYQLTAYIKSFLTGCQQPTGTVVSVQPAGVSVTPGTFLASNVYSPVIFTISGPGATAGTNVSIVIQLCCVSPTGAKVCCTDTLRITLPRCPDGCFRLLENSIICKPTPNGNVFNWCFNFLNQSGFTAYYFTMLPPLGVTITPGTLIFPSGVAPGAASPYQCVTIGGPGAVPGSTIVIVVHMCDKQRVNCCTDSIRLTLPDCPKPDCCHDFMKRFAKLSNSASSSGAASLNGLLWAAGPGGAPIIAASASLVSVTVNGQPAWGSFTSGNILPMGAGAVPPTPGYPFPQDITWGPMPAVNLIGAPFNLGMQFQPMAPNRFVDVLRYCIRFRYTDRNCLTCDTVLCFSRLRFRLIWLGDVGIWNRLRNEKSDDRAIAGAPAPPISGTLLGGDSGQVTVNFPTPPAELGTVKYIGMTLSAMDSTVALENVTSDASGYDLFFADGSMLAVFNADPGASVRLQLRYNGTPGLAVRHHMTIAYEVNAPGSSEPDTLTEEVDFTLRHESAKGGDKAGPVIVDLSHVRTYAIHLTNQNGAQSPIAAFGINQPDGQGGVKIIAVGPTASESQVLLKLGRNGGTEFVAEDAGDAVVPLEPGQEHGPIYVTLAGVESNAVTLGFTTYDADGQEITRGDLTLSSPLSSVHGDDAGGASAAMLGQSFPNPASHSATIDLRLPASQETVSLVVSDASGRVVATLLDGERLGAGDHAVVFDTANLPSGTYYYTLRAGSTVETRSMQVVK